MNKIKGIKAMDVKILTCFSWIFSHFDIDSAKTEITWLFKTYKMIRQVLYVLQKLLFSNKEMYYLKNLNNFSVPQWQPE